MHLIALFIILISVFRNIDTTYCYSTKKVNQSIYSFNTMKYKNVIIINVDIYNHYSLKYDVGLCKIWLCV